ncbi:MAG: hypothetical protein K6F96_07770 [Bacteroidales bacterium]|nr:hypothetical protein [Bacteroidales bacterium]
MKYLSHLFLAASLLVAGISLHAQSLLPQDSSERRVTPYVNTLTPNATCRKAAKAGIILIGGGDTLRACNPCNQSANNGLSYADICNIYKRELGDSVNVYCMPIPTAIEYYCPDAARSWTHPEAPVLNNMFAACSDSVLVVNIYNILGEHAAERIFSRTDHHWAPRGAYYAAMKLCQVAGVPFEDLAHYDEHVIHRFVGTMASFSGENCVKEAPEDFYYYTPRDCEYTTTYIQYKTQKQQIIGEHPAAEGDFFKHYDDGSGAAYNTFMGGDSKITQVRTGVNNGRRVIIFKDSFGNAIPGYLFFSFEEVHVIDFRFFDRNIVDYIKDNKITDVVFANNLTHACGNTSYKNYKRFLTQGK